mmetsp:Transcript_104083/g.293506  ORF Transcript_104083/g.293506 Transcript_104083/m.293506 type:complete len:245 (-) Transcript_104083:220-954(-)
MGASAGDVHEVVRHVLCQAHSLRSVGDALARTPFEDVFLWVPLSCHDGEAPRLHRGHEGEATPIPACGQHSVEVTEVVAPLERDWLNAVVVKVRRDVLRGYSMQERRGHRGKDRGAHRVRGELERQRCTLGVEAPGAQDGIVLRGEQSEQLHPQAYAIDREGVALLIGRDRMVEEQLRRFTEAVASRSSSYLGATAREDQTIYLAEHRLQLRVRGVVIDRRGSSTATLHELHIRGRNVRNAFGR